MSYLLSKPDREADRLRCLEVLLSWKGIEIDGQSEKPTVNATDEQGRTALHFCAYYGLEQVLPPFPPLPLSSLPTIHPDHTYPCITLTYCCRPFPPL